MTHYNWFSSLIVVNLANTENNGVLRSENMVVLLILNSQLSPELREMTQPVRALEAFREDLNSVLSTHMVACNHLYLQFRVS